MQNQYFVSTQWLQDNLNNGNLRVFDVRGHVIPASEPHPHYFAHQEAYNESHIPGAVFIDWRYDITDADSANGTQAASPEKFTQLMSASGVDQDTFVVTYDDAGGLFAARVWWMLNYYGHKTAAILNGGWNKWIAEFRPVTAKKADIPQRSFIPLPDPRLRRTIDEVATATTHGRVLLDVRSSQEFAGESSRARRKGHIPGAVNIPRKSFLNENLTIRPAHEIQEILSAAGIDNPETEIIVYCNAGVSASYGMMALQSAGYHNVSVYDGSWKEWANNSDHSIE